MPQNDCVLPYNGFVKRARQEKLRRPLPDTISMKTIPRLAFIYVAATLVACGGGGAAVEPRPSTNNPPSETPTPSTPSTPTTPGATIVTTVGTSFSPTSVTIAPGSSVTWQIAGATHNVTFGGTKPTGGDIPDSGPGTSMSRTFANPGTYDYQCTRHSGMTGRVVVTGDGAGAPPSNPSPSEGVIVQATSTAYNPDRVEIGVGGVVTWDIAAGAGGIVFDDHAPAGGNIPESSTATRVSRTFNAAGDYDYHNSRDRDIKGRIRVR